MFFLLYEQKLKQTENKQETSCDGPAKNTRVTYFFHISLVKYGKYECFSFR